MNIKKTVRKKYVEVKNGMALLIFSSLEPHAVKENGLMGELYVCHA